MQQINKNIFVIPKEEIIKIGEENQIYGYILRSGLKQIVNEIINITKYYKIKHIYGIDLGCGDGQTIDYFNYNIENSEWIGIELSNYRISMALNPDLLIEGNLLDLSYNNYNFIYINNLAFDDELCNKIEIKLFNEFTGIVLVSNPFQYKNLISNSKIIKTIKADTNWQKSHCFYFYLL
jgi:hypothetical protein